jgi:hypothetical protein
VVANIPVTGINPGVIHRIRLTAKRGQAAANLSPSCLFGFAIRQKRKIGLQILIASERLS